MNKKLAIAIMSIVVIAVVVSALLIPEILNQNPKIFCFAEESATSNWYMTEKSPVLVESLLTPFFHKGNFSSLPNVNLGISIVNNYSKELFHVAIEVSYKTIEDKWNTFTNSDIGFLDINQGKYTRILLYSPRLFEWHTQWQVEGGEGGAWYHWENVTVYVLNASNYHLSAFGFAKP